MQYLQACASYLNIVKAKAAIYCVTQYSAVERRCSGGPLHVPVIQMPYKKSLKAEGKCYRPLGIRYPFSS